MGIEPGLLSRPDEELVRLARDGSEEAFGLIVERYHASLVQQCARIVGSNEAEDAAQEAFFKAYRALGTFRPGAKFSTWIFTICYRACCDRLSKRKRLSREELPDRADPSAGPAALAERNDEARRLHAAIEDLPEKYNTVITLYHLQGKQYEEIATVLNLPLGTVKTHLFRAKEQLRKALSL